MPLENLEVSERLGIIFFHKSYRCSFLSRYSSQPCLLSSVRTALQLENLALRHQIGVLQRSARKRPKLTAGDRLLWIYLSPLWRDWRSVLAIVKPVTVVAWHRASSRLFWTWKVRRCHRGRPILLRAARDLIHKMCRKNLGWRAPRLHGELLKLDIDIGESGEGHEPLRNSQKAMRAVA